MLLGLQFWVIHMILHVFARMFIVFLTGFDFRPSSEESASAVRAGNMIEVEISNTKLHKLPLIVYESPKPV